MVHGRLTRRIARMTLKQIAALGRKLTLFLSLFGDCFKRCEGRCLLRVYVNGQLSNIHRKHAEGDGPRIWHPPSNAPAVPGIDQVGRRKTTRSVPANRRPGACSSGSHRLRGRIGHGQERQGNGRRRSTMEWQSREDRQLCRGSSSQLLCARLSNTAG